MTDTVGFIRKLPHGLVEAFQSTLEQVASAELLVHIVDASHPDPDVDIAAVDEVLGRDRSDGSTAADRTEQDRPSRHILACPDA